VVARETLSELDEFVTLGSAGLTTSAEIREQLVLAGVFAKKENAS
jgi:hypothetical protein